MQALAGVLVLPSEPQVCMDWLQLSRALNLAPQLASMDSCWHCMMSACVGAGSFGHLLVPVRPLPPPPPELLEPEQAAMTPMARTAPAVTTALHSPVRF